MGNEVIEREQTTLRLPENLKGILTLEANKKGMKFNQLVVIILNEYVNRQK